MPNQYLSAFWQGIKKSANDIKPAKLLSMQRVSIMKKAYLFLVNIIFLSLDFNYGHSHTERHKIIYLKHLNHNIRCKYIAHSLGLK